MKNRKAVARMKRVVKGNHWDYSTWVSKFHHNRELIDKTNY